MQLFTIKYQPKRLNGIIGQDTALKLLKDFVINYKKQKKKTALLYGPSGTGKTASVHALANDLGLELVEVNASDTRNKEQIEQRIGAASKQISLFSKGKIILVDEIDGLAGKEDRGGMGALIKLIQKSFFPIIMTITNPWDNKFSKLRNKSELMKFEHLDNKSIFLILKNICTKEKLKIGEAILKRLARKSGGDARAAIIDLQSVATYKKEGLDELGEREKEESIKQALLRIFKTTKVGTAIRAFDNVKENLNEQLLWLDANLPKEYTKPEDLARAYDKLSKADIFNRRIRRWQYWRFLVYINALITGGIAVSKDEKYKKFVKYNPTGRILKLWWAKQKSMKKKAIAAKIAEHTHASTRTVLPYMDYFGIIFKKDKIMANKIIKQLELGKEEVEWLRR